MLLTPSNIDCKNDMKRSYQTLIQSLCRYERYQIPIQLLDMRDNRDFRFDRTSVSVSNKYLEIDDRSVESQYKVHLSVSCQ